MARNKYERDEVRTDLPKALTHDDMRKMLLHRLHASAKPKVERQKTYERSTQKFKAFGISKTYVRYNRPGVGWNTKFNKSPRAYGVYLERPSKKEVPDGEKQLGFNEDRADIPISETAHEWHDDRRFYEFIFMPSNGIVEDMTAFVRPVMAAIERDLETKLEWIAVQHFDHENQHAHVMVRAVDERGKDLWIDPQYLAYGVSDRLREVLEIEFDKQVEQDLGRERSR